MPRLVVGRHMNEAVLIGPNIRVQLVGYNHDGSIRVSIEAPREIEIVREEIVNRYPQGVKAPAGNIETSTQRRLR